MGELFLLAFALSIEPLVGIGGRSVGVVAERLALTVTFAIVATRWRLIRTILGANFIGSRSSLAC
jgi:hypothetical protein